MDGMKASDLTDMMVTKLTPSHARFMMLIDGTHRGFEVALPASKDEVIRCLELVLDDLRQ
jgi:hypothetical protein